MIRYYAYYNHGGYKDFYLGSNEDSDFSRYFLPLLSVYENDDRMVDKVKEWKELPSIINLSTDTSEYNYPKAARVMMSHAGYKLQYRIIDNKGVFALRDIQGSKDSYGRNCPFVMMMVADTDDEKKILRTLCSYIWKNLDESETLLSKLFVNDFEVNGLRFNLGEWNDVISRIIVTAEDCIDENPYNRPVILFVSPSDIRFSAAFEEQQITKNDVSVAYKLDSTDIYRYTIPQTYYGPSGCPPMPTGHMNEKVKQKENQEHGHSIRNALGLGKAEDMEFLKEAVVALKKRLEILEKKVQEFENK